MLPSNIVLSNRLIPWFENKYFCSVKDIGDLMSNVLQQNARLNENSKKNSFFVFTLQMNDCEVCLKQL